MYSTRHSNRIRVSCHIEVACAQLDMWNERLQGAMRTENEPRFLLKTYKWCYEVRQEGATKMMYDTS
jgi:hypothetical protein